MADITLKGNPIKTAGQLPETGSEIRDFKLTKTDLSDVTKADFNGKKILMNIFPSIDTSICAASVRKFNESVSSRGDVAVLCISADLPFAHKRFCGAEGIEGVHSLSEFRGHGFGDDYKCRITSGPMAGLLSRCILVTDENGKVVYTEQVPEITQEPDYEAAVKALG